jgi:hypothetical protein
MSSALLWECVRGGNSYLRRGQGPVTLSAEPGNLTHIHNFKYSGLAAKKAAGLTVEIKGKKEQISFTRKASHKNESKPNKLFDTVGLTKNESQARKFLVRSLALYRPDLLPIALVKYTKIKRAVKM